MEWPDRLGSMPCLAQNLRKPTLMLRAIDRISRSLGQCSASAATVRNSNPSFITAVLFVVRRVRPLIFVGVAGASALDVFQNDLVHKRRPRPFEMFAACGIVRAKSFPQPLAAGNLAIWTRDRKNGG